MHPVPYFYGMSFGRENGFIIKKLLFATNLGVSPEYSLITVKRKAQTG